MTCLLTAGSRLAIDLGLIVLALGWAAFFAAVEEAFARMTPGRVARLVAQEAKGARRVADIAADSAPTISTARFLTIIGQITATLGLWRLFGFIASPLSQALATGASATVALFVVVSVSARTVGRQHASAVSARTAALMSVLSQTVFFLPQLLIWLGNAITPGRGYPEGPFASEDELRAYVDLAEASNQIEADERKMIHSVVDLGDTIAREVMVPRPEVVYIEQSKSLRQALSLALRSGYSRIPVVGPGGLDDIVGVAYLKDISKRIFDHPEAESGETVGSLAREAAWCPDTKPADDLLKQMQASRTHLAVVVDEFGGTAGIATIEDILEEIVGEIVDEYDDELAPVTEIGPGRYRVLSRLSLADLGEIFGLELDDADVETVGGVLAKQLNQVPVPGARAVWHGLELTADQPMGRRHQVATILVRQAEPPPQPDDDHD
ncbi:MAG: hemolysin family protein [Propionibacteriaceae bacterium]|nr:hemolysin family protein [Propionibacteriaceae bacterium]